MLLTYHLLDLKWRNAVDLTDYEYYIRQIADRFPMITDLEVGEECFSMRINTQNAPVKNGVVRAFFTQLAQTPLHKFGDYKSGTFKIFIEKKPTMK